MHFIAVFIFYHSKKYHAKICLYFYLHEKKNASPTAKKIVEDKEIKAARIRYLKRSKENAEKFVESVILGDHYASVEDLKEALDYKAFIRTDPYMRRTGAEMEQQLFDDKDTD